MTTKLKNNADFKLLNTAVGELQKAESKSTAAVSAKSQLDKDAERELVIADKQLRGLHDEYKSLLLWLQSPENLDALREYSVLPICRFLNSFFSA